MCQALRYAGVGGLKNRGASPAAAPHEQRREWCWMMHRSVGRRAFRSRSVTSDLESRRLASESIDARLRIRGHGLDARRPILVQWHGWPLDRVRAGSAEERMRRGIYRCSCRRREVGVQPGCSRPRARSRGTESRAGLRVWAEIRSMLCGNRSNGAGGLLRNSLGQLFSIIIG